MRGSRSGPRRGRGGISSSVISPWRRCPFGCRNVTLGMRSSRLCSGRGVGAQPPSNPRQRGLSARQRPCAPSRYRQRSYQLSYRGCDCSRHRSQKPRGRRMGDRQGVTSFQDHPRRNCRPTKMRKPPAIRAPVCRVTAPSFVGRIVARQPKLKRGFQRDVSRGILKAS